MMASGFIAPDIDRDITSLPFMNKGIATIIDLAITAEAYKYHFE